MPFSADTPPTQAYPGSSENNGGPEILGDEHFLALLYNTTPEQALEIDSAIHLLLKTIGAKAATVSLYARANTSDALAGARVDQEPSHDDPLDFNMPPEVRAIVDTSFELVNGIADPETRVAALFYIEERAGLARRARQQESN